MRFLLLILFAASGFSALIYEIVWFQLLQLAIGGTTVSLAVLLTAYMGGLSPQHGFGRVQISRHSHPSFRAARLLTAQGCPRSWRHCLD